MSDQLTPTTITFLIIGAIFAGGTFGFFLERDEGFELLHKRRVLWRNTDIGPGINTKLPLLIDRYGDL